MKPTFIKDVGKNKFKKPIAEYRCKCGKIFTAIKTTVNTGRKKSCGCIRKEMASKLNRTHGMRHTPLYKIWNAMKWRCSKASTGLSKKYYHDRGISVCKEWELFTNFFSDMGSSYRVGLSLDRIDVNGIYSKSNCRWVTIDKQKDNKSTSRRFEYNGDLYTISELSKQSGVPYGKLYQRINTLGWSTSDAVSID